MPGTSFAACRTDWYTGPDRRGTHILGGPLFFGSREARERFFMVAPHDAHRRSTLSHFLAPLLLIACMPAMATTALGQQDGADTAQIEPVPIKAAAIIRPDNTRIEFIGLHTGDEPNPRLGGFREFKGMLVVEKGSLSSVSVEIEIKSIWTEFEKLTQHLMAADFFGADEYPTATFTSTSITPVGTGGDLKIVGTLNMHGTEGEISFPAKVRVNDQGLVLKSEFKIDRTLFGMDEHTDAVEKLASVSVVVGQATEGARGQDAAEENAEQQDRSEGGDQDRNRAQAAPG
jgi:polyisoprenoid-binding protein YceI